MTRLIAKSSLLPRLYGIPSTGGTANGLASGSGPFSGRVECWVSGDPEGNVWDVAFKHGSDFDHRGGFIYP
jgi:hypothetical protein